MNLNIYGNKGYRYFLKPRLMAKPVESIRHLANVFKEGELVKESNMQKMHIPNSDKPIFLYNLDVIISVGYRVKSLRGTESNCRNVEVSNCRVTIFYFPFSIFFSRAHEHTSNEHTN